MITHDPDRVENPTRADSTSINIGPRAQIDLFYWTDAAGKMHAVIDPRPGFEMPEHAKRTAFSVGAIMEMMLHQVSLNQGAIARFAGPLECGEGGPCPHWYIGKAENTDLFGSESKDDFAGPRGEKWETVDPSPVTNKLDKSALEGKQVDTRLIQTEIDETTAAFDRVRELYDQLKQATIAYMTSPEDQAAATLCMNLQKDHDTAREVAHAADDRFWRACLRHAVVKVQPDNAAA